MDKYRQAEGLSGSVLSELAKSPAHYKHRVDNPKEPTDAMLFGSLVHCMLLEPELVSRNYHLSTYDGVRRGKAWEAELAIAGSRPTFKSEVWKEAQAMVTACQKNKAAQLVLRDAEVEQEFFWEEDGVKCKGKLDIVKPGLIADYKTASDVSPKAFRWKVLDFGYLLQLAHYQAGVKICKGLDKYPAPLILAQESSAPYVAQVYSVAQSLLDEVHAKRKELLAIFKECTLNGDWTTGYSNGIMEIV